MTNLDQLLRNNIQPDVLAKLVRAGKVTPSRRFSREDLSTALQDIMKIMPRDPTELYEAEGTQIVRITIPGRNIVYHTMAINGEAIFKSVDAQGTLKGELVLEDESALAEELVQAGLPADIRYSTERRKPTAPAKPREQAAEPRTRPQHVFDASVLEYIHENGEALVFEALEHTGHSGKATIVRDPAKLERLLNPSLLQRVREHGLEVSVQSAVDYVVASRAHIQKLRRQYLSEFMSQPEVTKLVARFMEQHEGDLLRELLNPDCPEEERLTRTFDSARKIYHTISAQQPQVPVHHIVDGIRYMVLKAQEYAKTPAKEYEQYRDVTAKCLAYAKAADFVREDQSVKNVLLPIFENKEMSPLEANFEAARQLSQHIYNSNGMKDMLYMKMAVRGLWMFGHMQTEHNASRAGVRSAYGVEVEYIQPVSHLLRRHPAYHPLLWNGFEELYCADAFKDGIELDTALDCQSLGNRLYNMIDPAVRQRVFTDMRPQFPNRPLSEPGPGKRGDHLQRILRAYVGLHREEILAITR